MVKAFIFDLDGTLVDTHQANFEAYKKALADLGVEISYESFKKTIGMQAKHFLPLLAPGLDENERSAVVELKSKYYKELGHLTRLNVELVRFMRSMGPSHKIGLVTTAKRKNAEVILAHHGLAGYFDTVIFAEDVQESKPSPEGYNLALKNFGILASEAIAFEDSKTGQIAAESAGIAVVMIQEFAQ